MATRQTLIAKLKVNNPWLTGPMLRVIRDGYIQHGDNRDLLLNEVRNGDGRKEYDKLFPGNRREDGTLRLGENAYLSNKYQYEDSLRRRGLNPEAFRKQLGQLVVNNVGPDEFESRIAAINESIATRTDGFRKAFAQASGLNDFSAEGVLAVAIDPDGVGRELLERRISLAQIRGSALDAGLHRSQARAIQLHQRGYSLDDVADFDRTAKRDLRRLGNITQAYTDRRSPGQRVLERAKIEGDTTMEKRFTSLLQRERAGFSSTRGVVGTTQQGTVTGLASRRARG